MYFFFGMGLASHLRGKSLYYLFSVYPSNKNGHSTSLTIQAYREKIGGLEGALDRKAQAVYESLEPEAQACAQWIFLELTNLGEGTEDTRRRVYKSDLVREKYPEELVERTLKVLTDARLIVTNQEENEEADVPSQESTATVLESDELSRELAEMKREVTVEVAHEILIRHWGTLRWWLDENRTRLRKQREIEQLANLWEKKGKDRGSLLRGSRLVDAKELYKNYRDELSPTALEYINASKKAHLLACCTLVFAATFMIAAGGFAFSKDQQLKQEELIRYTESGQVTRETVKTISTILPRYLKNTNNLRRNKKIDYAIADYRNIWTITNKSQQKMTDNQQEFQDLSREKKIIGESLEAAETSLAEMIRQHRLPQLEAELREGNFGELIESDYSKFENQYTGALRVTYAILMREIGAHADRNNDGVLNEDEESAIPCETLNAIEELWRKYTENRCGWYGSNLIDEEPNCREFGGQTLTATLLYFPPSVPLMESRLSEQCQVVTVPKSANTNH